MTATTGAAADPAPVPLLRVRGLGKRYGSVVALDGFDLDLDRGRTVALLGHNGSGKSTAVRCLGGLLAPSTGRVEIDGRDAARDEPATRAARSVVPDAPAFYPDLTVREHLLLIATAHGLGDDADDHAGSVLDALALETHADVLPQHLSSGLRQRAQLACGLVRPFDLLLLDEPTSYLDRASSDRLHARLAAEAARGAGIVVVSHDPRFVRDLADELVVLVDGVVGARGGYDEVLASDAAARAGLDATAT